MVESGIILIKYWLEVGPDEQTRRLESRINDPRKVWKLSDLDLLSYSRWFDYSRARDDMFRATDTTWAPWFVAHTDDKKRGRLNIITHLLGQIPYTPMPKQDVKLPKRKNDPDYVDPHLAAAPHPGEVLSIVGALTHRPASTAASNGIPASGEQSACERNDHVNDSQRDRGSRRHDQVVRRYRRRRSPGGSEWTLSAGCPRPRPPSGWLRTVPTSCRPSRPCRAGGGSWSSTAATCRSSC